MFEDNQGVLMKLNKMMKVLAASCVFTSGVAIAEIMQSEPAAPKAGVDHVSTMPATKNVGTIETKGSWKKFGEAENVKGIQESLAAHGHIVGPIDGLLGPQTRAALREFQANNNLTVTGSINQETIDKLGVDLDSREMPMGNDVYAE